MIGATLGHNRIIEKLGEGGMGVVYKAHDTKLDREVAIKVLPEALAADRERLARFEREAKLLATLNHPNIAAIYGLEEAEGKPYLILELVGGRTLAERLHDGPVPMDDALDICRQIAEGLETAHEKGIIHRDLKPANIKITPEGKVKILDFGLAKALQGETAPVDASKSPTLSEQMTRVGVILGTAAYMSPEQAKGRPVDKRTDIWAFGCLLYEMLSGRGAFGGESVTETLAAITRDEPDWSALPEMTPARVRELLDRCLRKDARQRLRDIGDARLILDETPGAGGGRPFASVALGGTALAGMGARALRVAHWVLTAACLLLLGYVGVALLAGWWPFSPQVLRVMRLSITHPFGGQVEMAAISPDGRRVAYVAPDARAVKRLWVRKIDAFEPQSLEGTEGALHPFWSPDSRWIGFGTFEALKQVDVASGAVKVIARSPQGVKQGAAWSRDGIIICAPIDTGGLFRVTSDRFDELTNLSAPRLSLMWPNFLPDGRRFLFMARDWRRSAEASEGGIYLGSLDTGKSRHLLRNHSNPVYAPPGYLIFQSAGELMAAPFDAATEKLGDPVSLGERVDIDANNFNAAFSVAQDGTIAIGGLGSGVLKRRLQWVDRAGKVLGTLGEPDYYEYSPSISTDGSRVAVAIADVRTASTDIWMFDSKTSGKKLLTTSPAWDGSPVWSPDGKRIVYATNAKGLDDVYECDDKGGAPLPLIESTGGWEQAASWSPDGRYLLIRKQDPGSQDANLYAWSWSERKLTPFLTSPAWEWSGIFSPDGRFVAYSSTETGRFEVWVTTFPIPKREQTCRITQEGAIGISWSKDRREILVGTFAGNLVGVPVSPDTGCRVGPDSVLIRGLGNDAWFAAANADHTRFLVKRTVDAGVRSSEVRLLFGWAEALRRGLLPSPR